VHWRFPVTDLTKDTGDLLELSAHSSMPTHLHHEEHTAWEEQIEVHQFVTFLVTFSRPFPRILAVEIATSGTGGGVSFLDKIEVEIQPYRS
jgi:hypothetical protein